MNTNNTAPAGVVSSTELGERTCEQGCNGCDEYTDFDHDDADELTSLQNALKQLADDFVNSIWPKVLRELVRRWVTPSRAHLKHFHRNPKRRALRKR